MPRSERLRQHLPSLYRPEADAGNLLNQYLEALGLAMDGAQEQLTTVMQSHWFHYADKASFDEHGLRDRERRGLPPYNVRDPDDQLEIARYPYIDDLARHGKLVGIAPWKEPSDQKDLVENYRRRIRKILSIYLEGLGTPGALRSIVEAELPWALERPLPERIRSFAVEEGISFTSDRHDVSVDGVPADAVGALMRWRLNRHGAQPTKPTLLIHGTAPLADEREATDKPLVERYDPDREGLIGIGVAYTGTVPEDQTLRLRPARRSWLTGPAGLLAAAEPEATDGDADPAANGPWDVHSDTPPVAFNCLLRTACGSLWLAGEQQLWRFDGSVFTRVLETESFAAIHCLQEIDGRLYIGCEDGLYFADLYPGDGSYGRSAIAELSGVAIHQIAYNEGNIWLATAQGPRTLQINPDNSAILSSPLFDSPTYSLLIESQAQYFGCELGLLRFDISAGQWHGHRGETEGEPQTLWVPIDPDALPEANDMGLPPVRHLARTPDRALWLGTDNGLARSYARHERDLLYRAVLEAFPDLIDGQVHQLTTDDRGMLWVASNTGLYRYDGRDIAQYLSTEGRWRPHGRADSLYPNDIAVEPRGRWRFNRHEERWEQFDSGAKRWADNSLDHRAATEAPVLQALVCDSLIAELGSWDGGSFSPQTPVPLSDIRMRCKPDPQTIVDGGPPFIPGLPDGKSTWRYLQLEQPPVTPPAELPWWSREGRLFPPPDMTDVWPGRYRDHATAEDGRYDESVFAYLPSAKITMVYDNALTLGVNVRLFRRGPEDAIDPAILDRVYQGIERVRPAGVPVTLSVENKLVRGAER